MSRISKLTKTRARRTLRVRRSLKGGCQHRLSVHTTGRHVYAQLIDDASGTTVAFANSCEQGGTLPVKTGGNVAAALLIGRLIAQRAVAAGVKTVLFDRGGKRYHGRVAAVADAARECGLVF